jgi:AcrR family transcriptional regulator
MSCDTEVMILFENEKLDSRVKYTRQWTFEALVRLMEHKPYQEIKITNIISKAGISRATFYRNFTNKDDIVLFQVQRFFSEFHEEMLPIYQKNDKLDVIYLIQAFFKRMEEHGKLIDTVIRANLEYSMVDGMLDIIYYHKERFYELIKVNTKMEEYTIEIVASSLWTLISKWHRNGKEESPRQLSSIYLNTFKSVYKALFESKK